MEQRWELEAESLWVRVPDRMRLHRPGESWSTPERRNLRAVDFQLEDASQCDTFRPGTYVAEEMIEIGVGHGPA